MAETYQYPAEQIAKSQVGPDNSLIEGALAGAGAGWLFGPLGALVGAGVGILSKRMHRSELEKVAYGVRAGFEEQDALYRLYNDQFKDLHENTFAVVSEDIDKRQLQMNHDTFQRANAEYLNAKTPQARQAALEAMSAAQSKMEDQGLLDIEARTRQLQDAEQQFQRDLAKQENQAENIEEQIILREQSMARGRDYQQNKQQADEYAGFVDSHTVGEDKMLSKVATTLQGNPQAFVNPATGDWHLPPDLRQELRNNIEVVIERSGLTDFLSLLPNVGKVAERYVDGADLSDAELMALHKAVNDGAIEQSQRRLGGLLPILEAQAAEIGVNPEHIRSGYAASSQLSEQQLEWRRLYDAPWSDARKGTRRDQTYGQIDYDPQQPTTSGRGRNKRPTIE